MGTTATLATTLGLMGCYLPNHEDPRGVAWGDSPARWRQGANQNGAASRALRRFPVPIVCKSTIRQVTIHARGAVVTRRVEVPGEETSVEGELDLVIPSITLLAEGGSVRASLSESTRRVASVETALVVPEAPVVGSGSLARVRELAHQIDRVQAEDNVLAERRRVFGETSLAPRIRRRHRKDEPRDAVDARVSDAVACAALITALTADLDARRAVLADELRKLKIALDGAKLRDMHTPTMGRAGKQLPTRTVTVRLGGRGTVGFLDVTYVVPAARWWPVYTLRIDDSGARASLIFEAAVAQLSGEDWAGVPLALSTADILYDARLPELASLRFGRTQKPPRPSYRPPPPGLERMFEGYDTTFGLLADGHRTDQRPIVQRPILHAAKRRVSHLSASDDAETAVDDDLEATRTMLPNSVKVLLGRSGGPLPAPPGAPALMAPQMAPMRMRAGKGAIFGAAAGVIGEAVISAVHYGAEPPVGGRAASTGGDDGAAAGAGGSARTPFSGALGLGVATRSELDDEEIEPGGAWLDFDALTLAPVVDFANRGRLLPKGDAMGERAMRDAVSQIASLAEPPGAKDPLHSRGMFDHRYDAAGRAEIPSDGRIHRLPVAEAEAAPSLRWRTAPRELAEVFREAVLTNPFPSPLLAGPVDVYAEGSLVTVTQIRHVDRGGKISVGMGVDDRVRVARNVRVEEESAGLLGGSIAVRHTVTIDLTSALGREATVEVVDRIPVTDDKVIEIKVVSARPEGDPYDQVDRDAPIRGGLRWRVALAAGGKAKVELVYRVVFANKHEIVGGNRRD